MRAFVVEQNCTTIYVLHAPPTPPPPLRSLAQKSFQSAFFFTRISFLYPSLVPAQSILTERRPTSSAPTRVLNPRPRKPLYVRSIPPPPAKRYYNPFDPAYSAPSTPGKTYCVRPAPDRRTRYIILSSNLSSHTVSGHPVHSTCTIIILSSRL